MLAFLMDHCLWVSAAAGLLMPVPAVLLRLRLQPFVSQANDPGTPLTKKRQILAIAALQQIAALGWVLLFPFLLKWYFRAPALFSFAPGYRPCLNLYVATLVVSGGTLLWWFGLLR
jgi:hypothetical protein